MNYIGKKIKELRLKNDMTQEKLADRLGIAYQTVSKWETGITSPDLSLIVPLARLFRVTTDELFCYSESADDLLKEKLENEYEQTWQSGDLKRRFEISEQAVREFPGDMQWLDRLAWTQAMRSFEYEDNAEYIREQEEAIKKFAAVIDNTADGEVRSSSILGIVQNLSLRGRNDEAKAYAELYPESDSVKKDEVMLNCLCGEEKEIHYQKMLDKRLLDLLNVIGRNSRLACEAQQGILKIMMPDENYAYYNCILSDNFFMQARFKVNEKDFEGAVEMLKKSLYYAEEYDKCVSADVVTYTGPFFSKLQVNTSEICRTGTATLKEEIKERLMKNPWFEPLKNREDFNGLF